MKRRAAARTRGSGSSASASISGPAALEDPAAPRRHGGDGGGRVRAGGRPEQRRHQQAEPRVPFRAAGADLRRLPLRILDQEGA